MEGIAALAGMLIAVIVLVLPFASFITSIRAHSKIRELTQETEHLRREVARITAALRRDQAAPAQATPSAPAPSAPGAEASAPGAAPHAAPTEAVAPPSSPAAAAARIPLPPIPSSLATPAAPAAPPTRAAGAPPVPPPSGPGRPRTAAPPFDWERFFGVKFFSWIAGIALVIAAGFFLVHAVQQGWLAPPIRLAVGLLVGAALVIGCELKVARDYQVTSSSLHGAGIAILLASLWAGNARWDLLPVAVAFLGMALVAAVAVGLSIRRDSPFIAMLGLAGGYATPVALPGSDGNVAGLFGYLLVLCTGLGIVAMRKRWTVLLAASLLMTTFYQWRWVVHSLREDNLGAGLVIFLVFPLANAALLALAARRHQTRDDTRTVSAFRQGAAVASALPVGFAIFVAVRAEHAAHPLLVLGFLLVVVAGMAALGVLSDQRPLTAVAGLASIAGWGAWLLGCREPALAWPLVLPLLAAFVALHAGLPLVARRRGTPFGGHLTIGAMAAPVLMLAVARFAVLPADVVAPALVLGAPIVLLLLVGGAGLLLADVRPFAAGVLAVAACHLAWSQAHQPPSSLVAVLPALALAGLAALAVPWLVAARRGAEGAGPMSALAVSSVLLLLPLVVDERLARSVTPSWIAMIVVLGIVACAHALERRHEAAMTALLAGGQLALGAWVFADPAAPAHGIAGVVSLVLSALGVATWIVHARLAARSGSQPRDRMALAAGLSLPLSAIVMAVHAAGRDVPSVSAMTVMTVTLVALSALLAIPRLPWFMIVAAGFAVLPLIVSVAGWTASDAAAQGMGLAASALVVHAGFVAAAAAGTRLMGLRTSLHVAAAVSTLPAFLLARHGLIASGHRNLLGLLALVLAASMLGLLAHLLRAERVLGEAPSRRAVLAGTALAFITAAIPLQLDNEWVTVGLALECAGLAWLRARRIEHRGLTWWALGLAGAVFVRLSLNPAVLQYHPRAEMPVLNWFLYAYGLAAVALLAAAHWLASCDDALPEPLPRVQAILRAFAGIILFLLLNIEIADFWSEGPTLTFEFNAGLAQDLSYTLGWALFGVALLLVGIAGRSRAARLSSIGLLLVVVLKAFLHDLLRLGGLYRVGAFVGLAVSLALVAVLFQRFVLRKAPAEPKSEPTPAQEPEPKPEAE